MRVLIACERSGIVRDAFIARGHDAISCDLEDTRRPGPHYKGDVRDILYDPWDLLIAHPPCTFLSNSGVRHFWDNPERFNDLILACDFFELFINAKHIPKRVIENPIHHRYAKEYLGDNAKYSQIIHPWQFGHEARKQTCLWLYGLPKLIPTNIVNKGEMVIFSSGKKMAKWYKDAKDQKNTQELRSNTFTGIAQAMADQWG